ncbi:MAG: hypothetical protein ACR2G3_11005 [Solirubrobacterales bacterium]
MWKPRTGALVAALALALTGCGGSDSEEEGSSASAADEEAVTEVANAFFTDGLTKGDLGACDLLTPEAEKAFAQVYKTNSGTCGEGIAFLSTKGNPSNTLYDIQSVEVNGDNATVTFAFSEATLVRDGDTWLISETGL